MAYETGTSTGVVDLLTKLFTFATANGWTQDQAVGSGKAAMHRNNIYVSFRYDTSSPNNVGIYQALGYVGGNDPGNHTNDSGNGSVVGFTNANIALGRLVGLGTSSFPAYYFFESDTYLHVVVEVSTGSFRHFGFGTLVPYGDGWTGNEYAYGQVLQGANASAVNNTTTALLDGLATSALGAGFMGTVHVEGLPSQAGSSKWGVTWADRVSSQGTDRAGNARVFLQGGFRGGPISSSLSPIVATGSGGLGTMWPIQIWYRTGTDVYLLGEMPDVRGVNVRYHAPAETMSIGGDDWMFFPTVQRDLTVSVNGASAAQGIAYKKVTT